MNPENYCRRKLIQLGAALPVFPLLSTTQIAAASTASLDLTVACVSPVNKTRAQSAGPFFTPDTPHRNDFRDGDKNGTPFQLFGFVKSRDCQPIPNALIELWHADSQGRYDNRGYKMRGHQFTDDKGRFVFLTTVPGRYPGRTLHYHVKVQASGQQLLTTQLYFPDEPANKKDWIFRQNLLMAIGSFNDVAAGRFDFVV
jgi:protocatechuate 3,4-dioxygenase beta subunit